MQLNIDLDKSFIDDLQKQFSTPNVKEALYQLLDFYKQNRKEDTLKEELQKRVEAIENGTEVLTPYMDGMDEMLQRLKSKHANS
jgi:CRISPR/Cas system-associated endonuclease Cas3-HD